jgi:hypothetical protein
VGSAGQILRSTGTLPAYTTATYPSTFVAGDLAVAGGGHVETVDLTQRRERDHHDDPGEGWHGRQCGMAVLCRS